MMTQMQATESNPMPLDGETPLTKEETVVLRIIARRYIVEKENERSNQHALKKASIVIPLVVALIAGFAQIAGWVQAGVSLLRSWKS